MPEIVAQIDLPTAEKFLPEDLIAKSREINNAALRTMLRSLNFPDPNDKRQFTMVVEENKGSPGTTLVFEMGQGYVCESLPEAFFNPGPPEIAAAAKAIFKNTKGSPLNISQIEFQIYPGSYFSRLIDLQEKSSPENGRVHAIYNHSLDWPDLSITLAPAETKNTPYGYPNEETGSQLRDYTKLGLKAISAINNGLTRPSELKFETKQRMKITAMLDANVSGMFVFDFRREGRRDFFPPELKEVSSVIKGILMTSEEISLHPDRFTLWLRQGEPEIETFKREVTPKR
ncbi:hypothetical protein HY440_00300 [Candidatus Microgenomates bacterium]|nr:hypothetical protein [Candidatus Microgenomates bacterium]